MIGGWRATNGVPATYDAVAAHVQVDKESGASLQQLCGAANEFGLEVESRFVSPDALLTASRHSFPMILHLQDGLLTPNGHFVVAVERIDGGKFRIFDPTTSRTAEKSAKQAFAHFSGYVLTVKQRFFSPATRIAVPCVLVLGLGFCCWVRRRCRS